MSRFDDNLSIDVTELRLKWAVEDTNIAAQKLIKILDQRQDIELIQATSDYLDKIATYVEVADEVRREI